MVMDQSMPSWVNAQKNYRKCPRCKSGDLDTRVRRSPLVKNLLFFIDLKRYECSSCGYRTYIIGKPSQN